MCPGSEQPGGVRPRRRRWRPPGSSAPRAWADAVGGERPGRAARAATASAAADRRRWRPDGLGQRGERGAHVVAGAGQHVDRAAIGHQVAGLARVGEERHGRLGVDQHQVAEAVELHRRELGEVGEALDGTAARRRARCGPGTSRRAAWLRCRGRRGLASTRPAPWKARPPTKRAAGSSPSRTVGDGRHGGVVDRGAVTGRRGVAGSAPSVQRHVGGEDQRGDLAGRTDRRRDRVGGVGGDGRRRRPTCGSRSTRCGPRSRCRTRAGRRTLVVGGVVADDVDDRGAGPCGRCAGWPGRCRGPVRGAAAWPPGWSAMRA